MLYSFENQQLQNGHASATPEDPTDEELMAAIKRRDDAALAMLYRRRMPLVRTVVTRIVTNDQDAEDLVQEAFLEIWNRAEHYSEEKGKALGWIVTMVRRRAIDKLRKKQAYFRAQERLRLETEVEPDTALHCAADDQVIAEDAKEIFQTVLAHLPTAQKEAMQLAFFRGMSQREIAAKTGIPLGTIKTRLELGLRKVRASILALGGRSEWMPSLAHA